MTNKKSERNNTMEFDKLKNIIASVLNLDPNEITMETTFVEDLGADSLDIFQIVMEIESEFNIELKPEDVELIQTVGEAMELMKRSK